MQSRDDPVRPGGRPDVCALDHFRFLGPLIAQGGSGRPVFATAVPKRPAKHGQSPRENVSEPPAAAYRNIET
ncbi:hypothetical protein BCEP27_11092 [Burkholderia cepacia]